MNDTQTKSTLDQVIEWHKAFGVPIKETPDISDLQLNNLRMKLLNEELFELNEALFVEQSIVKTLDALLDLQYVLDGAFATLGFSKLKDPGFAEVQRSNMSKMGEDGVPIYRADGKVMKGPNFTEPNLKAVLNQHHPEFGMQEDRELLIAKLQSEGGALSTQEGLVNIQDVELIDVHELGGEPVVEFIHNEQIFKSRIFKAS